MGLAEEKVPEAEFAGLCLEFLDDGDDRLPPRCVTRELSSRQPLRRPYFLLQIPYELAHQLLLNVLRTSRKVMSFARVSFAYGENLSSIYKPDFSLAAN